MSTKTRAYQISRKYLLRSNFGTLVTLTVLFLYTSWLYTSVKNRTEHHQSRNEVTDSNGFIGHHQSLPGSSTQLHPVHASDNIPVNQGHLVGSQVTSWVKGGTLFSWGLDDSYRLGLTGGDSSVPEITMPHVQVVSMAASRHSLLLTTDGQLLSMGSNNSAGGGGHGSKPLQQSGQLGRPTGSSAPGVVTLSLLNKVTNDSKDRLTAAGAADNRDSGSSKVQDNAITNGLNSAVVQVATGRYHSVAVTADGSVYTWGLNDWGQLGRTLPSTAGGQHLEADAAAANDSAFGQGLLQEQQEQRQAPANHSNHSSTDIANSTNSTNICSHGWSCHAALPGRVPALANHTFVAAAAGRYSTMVLDSAGRLWVWGYDGCATGEVPAAAEAWQPRLIEGQLKGQQVVAFGIGYTFWLAATSDGQLYTCDHQDDGYAGTLPHKRRANHAGQLGRSGRSLTTPGLVDALSHKRVISVAAGREHAVVATADGEVYTFGGGRAVLGREGSATLPGKVRGLLEGKVVKHVAAGEYFSLAATDTQVFAWGSNAYLCLGNGNSSVTEANEPMLVSGPLGSGDWLIQGLVAGYQHAFAIAANPKFSHQPLSSADLAGDTVAVKATEPAATAAGVNQGVAGAAAAAGEPGPLPGAQDQRYEAPAAVEVVLTEEQLRARERYQRQQQQKHIEQQATAESAQAVGQPAAVLQAGPAASLAEAASSAVTAEPSGATDNSNGILASTSAGQQLSGNSSSSNLTAACARILQDNSTLPLDWHFSYLQKQLAVAAVVNAWNVSAVWASWSPSPWHEQLVALSRDVFDLLPKQYNPMHKNPCWGGLGPDLACLPYFNIIGVSKCGTTDLYHRLTMHREVLAATNKGPHFWDECSYPPQGPCTAGPSGDFKAYINLFSRAADIIRSRPNAITGEASSNTYSSANGVYLRGFRGDKPWAEWAGSAGLNATMPALLREAQPYLKLIVMFRNPVDRYHSAYHYYRWWLNNTTSPTPDEFHNHAVKEMQQWRDCIAVHGTADCVRRYQPQQLVKGMYAEFLQDWFAHFPRSQMMFLRHEDYTADIAQHLKAVLQFLGVPEPDESTWTAMTKAEPQNKNQYAPMRSDTRQLLQRFYDPFNLKLAKALAGECRWLWG